MQGIISGNSRVRAAVRAILGGTGVAAACGAASAQEAPAPAPQGESAAIQEVVVTGSRIAVPNQTSISPVTFVSAADIQQTGVTRVEDLLNQLPQIFADQNSNVSNGASGTASAAASFLPPRYRSWISCAGCSTKWTCPSCSSRTISASSPRCARTWSSCQGTSDLGQHLVARRPGFKQRRGSPQPGCPLNAALAGTRIAPCAGRSAGFTPFKMRSM